MVWSIYLGGDRLEEYDVDSSFGEVISIAMEHMADFVKAGGYGACGVYLEDEHGEIVQEVFHVHSDQPAYRQMALDHYCRNWDLVSVRQGRGKGVPHCLLTYPWLCGILYHMKNEEPTYTLWNGSTLIDTFDHDREGYDAALERAFDLGSCATIYSSRDDLVWSARDQEPNEPSDAWHDADALASAGMGTDEDYGYYGEEDYGYGYDMD